MSYCAIISEFNPFTNGHEYIVREAKRRTRLDVVCLMSGNVVQRGEMSCLDKYTRATHAIKAGAFAVLELPTIFAASSADDFGYGAVKCLSELKDISHLAFGVETTNTDFLIELAAFKANESKAFKTTLKSFVKNGDNYSVATFKALSQEFQEKENELKEIFDSSNNILALTYLTAIYKLGANITPVFIKRLDSGYNSSDETTINIDNKEKTFASASHVRQLVLENKFDKVKELVPEYVYNDLLKLDGTLLRDRMLISEALFMSALRNKSSNELYTYYDYRAGLAPLIYNSVNKNGTLSQVVEACTSKAYRESRIRKLAIYPYLNMTDPLVNLGKLSPAVINVIACDKNKKTDLSLLKRHAVAKIVISALDYNNLTDSEKSLIKPNQLGTNLYNLASSLPRSSDKAIFV